MSEARQQSGPISIGSTQIRVFPDGPLDAVWNALSSVYDPELGLDVVSLGLIYDVREEGDVVIVDMTLTTPGCPASESLPEMARMAIKEALTPEMAVEICVVWDPPWNPALMHEDAADALGYRPR